MTDRVDVIIFGASGFTGKYTVAELHRIAKERSGLTWGIAGRSEEKLRNIIKDTEKKSGDDLSAIQIIIADISNDESLQQMASRAKLVINCCGPYRFYGEAVVKACVEAGAHHIDVSGEPQYMERMQLAYNKQAQEKGIYVISACGFDSIPADLGTVYVKEKFEGTVNSIETYLESWTSGAPLTGASIHYGTWESAVYGLAHANELKPLRKQLYPERLPKMTPKLKSRPIIHRSEVLEGKWCVPFPGSDRSVVMRSQRHFYDHDKQRPIQMHAYIALKSVVAVIALAIIAGIFLILTKFSFGRYLLLTYPRIFSCGFASHDGPKEEEMERTNFSITFFADGWSDDKKLAEPTDQFADPPNKTMLARVKGVNPGYGSTCTALVLSALTVLAEKDLLPQTGGVFPPGAAFAKTTLIKQLNEHGITFEILNIKAKL